MKAEDYKKVLDMVGLEVERAKSMFPEDFHNAHEGYAVLLEEVDELWDEVKKNQKVYDFESQRKEAIQVAAMAIRFATELTYPKTQPK
jgi:NTP pyrophosphatase (non-canonical NTP hydrolase)